MNYPTSSAKAGTTKIRILADDLTGACDSAAAFLASGHTARVWLDAHTMEPSSESVQVINTASRDTASRDMEAREVFQAVARAASAVAGRPDTIYFKKIDSAGRGHIGMEVVTAHQIFGTSAIFVAPSFPDAGRTVRNGILEIRDAAGTNARIPLASLFKAKASAACLPSALISHPRQIPEALEDGAVLLLCDASTQPDLDALVAVDYPNLLYVGSAGLARALANRYSGPSVPTSASLPSPLSALTFCGTQHPVTKLQMQHLAATHRADAHLDFAAEPGDGPIILDHFERHPRAALILTGGHTAQLVLKTLGANSIVLRGELEPGIPWGIIQGGAAHDRLVITKSGGFGSPDTLTRIVQTLMGAAAA